MNYKHFREKNAKFHIFVLLSIMGGISLITIYDRKFRHNRPEEGLPKMITYISPINMVAEDNHLYFAYKSPLGTMFISQIALFLKRVISTIGSKIPFTPKGGRFCEENHLCYLDLCYVSHSYHKFKTSPLYRLWTYQKLQEIIFAKSATVKGILLPLIRCIKMNQINES